jgi:hypothetical protein
MSPSFPARLFPQLAFGAKSKMKSGHPAGVVTGSKRWLAFTLTVWGLLVCRQAGAVGSWIPLLNKPPGTNAGHMLLLSDGTAMVQQGVTSNWFRLTAGSTGGYSNGIWSSLAPMSASRKYYSSDVLPDGRVFIIGGEHNNAPLETNFGEIYNPKSDRWSFTAHMGAQFNFEDSGSEVLSNGTVLVHPVDQPGTNTTFIYDPTHDSWAATPPPLGPQGEASWVKLPDDSILSIDKDTQTSERFIPSLNQWIKDADVTVQVFANHETGPAFLLPDGRAFFLGASGHTALYTPTGTTNWGSWAAGPDIPNGGYADDTPGAMLVNGNILCIVGTNNANGGSTPLLFCYEYDYRGRTTNPDGTVNPNGAFFPTRSPTDSTIGGGFNAFSYDLSLLDLPDGTVLVSKGNGTPDPSGHLYVYQPDGVPLASGKPKVDSVSWNKDGSLHITGKLFNGISEGSAFGDDAQEASNYPLVRFTDSSGNIYYGRTYNWSSTGVMTGSKIVTTEATVPAAVASSSEVFSLQVVANGNASDPVPFDALAVWVDFNYLGSLQLGSYSNPYNALSNGVSAVSKGGTIAFKANVQPSVSHETMTISKPMTLISVGGPATVGQK